MVVFRQNDKFLEVNNQMASTNIDHMIDPNRPGYLKPYIMLGPDEYMEACKRGLKPHRGSDLTLVETSPNPTGAKVLGPLAPEEIRKRVEDAEVRFRERQALRKEMGKRLHAAAATLWQCEGENSSSTLTEFGVRTWEKLKAKKAEAEKDFRLAENGEDEARQELNAANQERQWWIDSERSRREEATRLAAAAKKPKTPSLPERLAELTKKVI